jgi:hypothetical protein
MFSNFRRNIPKRFQSRVHFSITYQLNLAAQQPNSQSCQTLLSLILTFRLKVAAAEAVVDKRPRKIAP